MSKLITKKEPEFHTLHIRVTDKNYKEIFKEALRDQLTVSAVSRILIAEALLTRKAK